MYPEDVALFFTVICLELPSCVPWRCCFVLYSCMSWITQVVHSQDAALLFTILLSTVLLYCSVSWCVPWRGAVLYCYMSSITQLCTLKMLLSSLLWYVLNYPVVCPEDTALFFIICLQLPSCVPWRCSSVLYYMSWIAHLCTQKRQCCSLLCLELLVVYPEETVLFFTMSLIPQLCTLKM